MTETVAHIINELSKHPQTSGYIYKPGDAIYALNGYALIIEENTDNVIAAAYLPEAHDLFNSIIQMLLLAKADGHEYVKVVGWHRWEAFTRRLPEFVDYMVEPYKDIAYIKLEQLCLPNKK